MTYKECELEARKALDAWFDVLLRNGGAKADTRIKKEAAQNAITVWKTYFPDRIKGINSYVDHVYACRLQ